MNFVLNAFIAALLYLAYVHQSAAALSVASGLIWVFTFLHFVAFFGSSTIKNKKFRPIRAFINGTADCATSLALVYLFGMVWLPTLYALSSALCISALLLNKEKA
ncbi:hypothetical protein [Burkholderia latens]|uniref:hypothetical protein n=1 Tax=Burkholderia latens TaxID=488446 RepID=UPI001AE8F9A3|nr:hypothetical protein [Burkholderia latens]QTO46344.1 hypothetical protein J8I85_18030 [Burkholderia latens]